MPNDLLPMLTDPTALAAYLAELAMPTAQDKEFDSEVDPNKINPRITMSKDNEMLTIKLGDTQLDVVRQLYVSIRESYGSRALWCPEKHPQKTKYPAPICSTGLVPPSTFKPDVAKGLYSVNEDFVTPYTLPEGTVTHEGDRLNFDCARCPFNRFESESSWDSTKAGSKGKACKEGRTLFIRTMERVPGAPMLTGLDGTEIAIFQSDEKYAKSPIRLQVGWGSNRETIEKMVLMAKARRLPVPSLVWKLTVKIEGEGSIRYPVAIFEPVGIQTPASIAALRAEDPAWIENFVKVNQRAPAVVGEVPF